MDRECLDEYWYERFLMEDSASRPLNYLEKSSIIKQCMQEAQRQKQKLEERFGVQTAEQYIQIFGYRTKEEEPELMPSFLYMGIVEPGEREVRLNMTVIRLLESYLCREFSRQDEKIQKLREIILFHELFHIIEESDDQIYTRSVSVSTRILGVIPWKRSVEAASEIGAVHFSRLLSEASFSPGLYIKYLLAATNQKADVGDEYRGSKKGGWK